MAERKFDYNNVGTVYQNMRKITGLVYFIKSMKKYIIK